MKKFVKRKHLPPPPEFNLYNLNISKENIKRSKKVIIGEGEKFCLMFESYFGPEADISVACCGSNLTSHQYKLLKNLDVEEIIIAFDKQFQKPGDNEWKRWTKKLTDLHQKYSGFTKVSFMFDNENLLPYKASPIDCGKDIFIKMYENRITLG